MVCAGSIPLFAQVPGEVTGVVLDGSGTISWDPAGGAQDYNVYRGLTSWLHSGNPPRCHGDEITATSFPSPADPALGQAFFYLVTAEAAAGEGTPGTVTGGGDRDLLGSCDTVMRNHYLDRLGYGWDEWTSNRLAALGFDAYIDEQLDPLSIDESSNTVLNTRLAPLEPPDDHLELLALDLVKGTYARRQLEQHVASFFSNHFSTYIGSVYQYYTGLFPPCGQPALPNCDPNFPARALLRAASDEYLEQETFRDLAFYGTFGEMVEFSARSPAMIYFLDTFNNIAVAPNENFARELLELHTMDVDTYVHSDIEELARIMTGWNVCAKLTGTTDPLDPCDIRHWREGREFVANFNIPNHDCGSKVLFAGTVQETFIPDSCDGVGQPTAAGADDLTLALDAIVAHPATAAFIARKLIQRFVTENPTQGMIDAVVAEWNDAGNPNGVGDMGEVLRAVLTLPALRDPDRVRDKIKTPVEHLISAMRAVRGKTDGALGVINYIALLQHIPYFLLTPEGYSEIGGDWIGTNNMLERQNFGLQFSTHNDPVTEPDFGADIIPLLQANGISTAPGNSAAIVDFFIDILFGGALTPEERQEAIDYLDTDDNGIVSDYDDLRIRETVGFLLGYAQFQEQ